MALLPHWPRAEKEAFLRQQFQLQDQHYRKHYPSARYDLILMGDRAIGRLYVAKLPGELRLMDIALLPGHRNQGIGGALLGELMEQAGADGRFVSLHVEAENPARRLYQRAGFVDAGQVGFYILMHWNSGTRMTAGSEQDSGP